MITKIQAAEHQLDTAIRLFFENIDHLSSYTLAAASREITDDLCEKNVHELFQQEVARLGDSSEVRLSHREEIKLFIKEEYYEDAMKFFRKRQNFLKHADKDPDGQMDELNASELAFVILFAGKNFSLLEKRITPALSTFLHWFGAAEPSILKQPDGTHPETYKLIEGLRETCHNLYSKEAFRAMHEALKAHYQPMA